MDALTAFIKDAGLPIILTDAAGLITEINPAAETLYALSVEKAVGQPISALSRGYGRTDHERVLWQIAQGGRPTDLLAEHFTSAGRALTVRLYISPVRNAQGTLVAISHICMDVTDATLTQVNLQKERDLLDGILETTNDAILMLDTSGRVVTTNLQFESFFHLPRFQVVGQPFDSFAEIIRGHAELPSALVNLLMTYGTDTNQSAGSEFETDPPERRVLVWYSAPVHAHDGSTIGRLFVFRDATREREVDRMKTEFVSLVSHELRTPLTSIKGFAEFILDGDAGPVNDELRSYLDIIRANADRLMRLIRDILDLTRIEAGRMELHCDNHSLHAIIDEALVSVRHMVDEHKQEIKVLLEEDLPDIWADRERMVQILVNLLGNASKYSVAGSKIRVAGQVVHPDDTLPPGTQEYISQPAFLISVHDRGMGIPIEEQMHIFERFYRTEQAGRMQIQGSGLGLAIVKSFVELHGGNIWLHSEPGKGTSFYFTIPLVEGI